MADMRRLLGLFSLASFGDASTAAGQGIGPNTITFPQTALLAHRSQQATDFHGRHPDLPSVANRARA